MIWPSAFQPAAMCANRCRGRRNSRNSNHAGSFGNHNRGRRSHRSGAVSTGKGSPRSLPSPFPQRGHPSPHHDNVIALCALIGVPGLAGARPIASEAVPAGGGVGSMCHWPLAVWCCPGFRVGLGASFASLGRLPASLFSPIGCLGCLLAICGVVPWSSSVSPGSCALFPLHARWRSTLCAKTWPLGWGCLLSCAPPRGCLWLRCAPFCNTRLQPKLRSRGSCVCVRSLFCSVLFSALCLILLSQLCSRAVFRFCLPPPGPWHMCQGGRCSKDARQVLAMSLGSWACCLDAYWRWSAAVDALARVACPFFFFLQSLIIGLAATTKEGGGNGRPFVFCSCSHLKCRGLVRRQRRGEGVASRCARLSLSGNVSERGKGRA
jgi:hypothetical protein